MSRKNSRSNGENEFKNFLMKVDPNFGNEEKPSGGINYYINSINTLSEWLTSSEHRIDDQIFTGSIFDITDLDYYDITLKYLDSGMSDDEIKEYNYFMSKKKEYLKDKIAPASKKFREFLLWRTSPQEYEKYMKKKENAKKKKEEKKKNVKGDNAENFGQNDGPNSDTITINKDPTELSEDAVYFPEIPFVSKHANKNDFSMNRIYFGAPGTGKSFRLDSDREKLLIGCDDTHFERVTFHPSYSYANFVGTYKPVKDSSNAITYEFVPGPFIRLYVKAVVGLLSGEDDPYLLLIEEINRAEVAAVFGDVFQLLDRDDNNRSRYDIRVSEDLGRYLKETLESKLEDRLDNDADKLKIIQYYTHLCIPNNMYIWASMNSADQGVFPMDTAFKRRWDFEYMKIDEGEKEINGCCFMIDNNESGLYWNALRKAINSQLARLGINEDKQMGAFFVSYKIVKDVKAKRGGNYSGSVDPDVKFVKTFENKVIMYLFDDAARQRRDSIFDKSIINKVKDEPFLRYSDICAAFETKGYMIFVKAIRDAYDENSAKEQNP